jgi:hypothetical protein
MKQGFIGRGDFDHFQGIEFAEEPVPGPHRRLNAGLLSGHKR